MKEKVVYLCGDPNEKRKMMRSGHPLSFSDNDEVSTVCRINGNDYYVVSEHPFADFTVHQYMSFMCSLITRAPLSDREAKEKLRRLRLKVSLKKKLKKLDVVTRRLVCLAPKVTQDTTAVALNFDGTAYSGRVRRRMTKLLARLSKKYSVTASVSDRRFVPGKGKSILLRLGISYPAACFDKTAKKVARRSISGLLSKINYPVPPIEKADIVCVK